MKYPFDDKDYHLIDGRLPLPFNFVRPNLEELIRRSMPIILLKELLIQACNKAIDYNFKLSTGTFMDFTKRTCNPLGAIKCDSKYHWYQENIADELGLFQSQWYACSSAIYNGYFDEENLSQELVPYYLLGIHLNAHVKDINQNE